MTVVRVVPPRRAQAEPSPDPSQRAALDLVASGVPCVITGGAGTGKTALVVAAAAEAVRRGADADRVLVVSSTRSLAGALRDRVSRAIGAPTSVPVARTAAATAFAILGARAALLGQPRPSLITGAEQDVVLRELLEGHASGRVAPLDWAGVVPDEATSLPGFREELRNLLMRAAEADLSPSELDALGAASGRPEWRAAAALYAEYDDVMTLRSSPADQGERFDPATLVARAADALAGWDAEVGGDAPGWDLVLVDDAQDATAATGALLRELASRGAQVVLVGNADESVQGYRGALPGALAAAVRGGAAHAELASDHRQAGTLARVSAAVAGAVGVKGVGSARAAARAAVAWRGAAASDDAVTPDDGAVLVLTAPHRYGESRAIAAELRRARHGLDGEPVPWGRMAVIARSAAALRSVRSDLLRADIPCESLGDGTALHRESAVAPLLTMLRAALGEPWTEEAAIEVLTSRLVGLDPVGVRRLRRQLVAEERVGGGARASSVLLAEALADPARTATLRGAEALAAGRAAAAVRAASDRAAAPAPTPGAVIWAAWQALGVADAWRASAIAGSARDDADLDAVIALLRAAQTFSERLPQARTAAFLDYLESQDFAADSLGLRAADADAVAFATPASALGREWDVVVLAGVEEGAWPNLAPRDSVLGAQRLAEALADGADGAALRASGAADARAARASVLDDETRALLVAVSRARGRLVVTAVEDGESRPSRFVSLVEQAAGVERTPSSARRSVADLRGAVAVLRAEAEAAADPGAHASMLSALAARGVQGADPSQWHGALERSTDAAFWGEDEGVRVSPSKVEWVETCALRWALESTGGTREATEAQEVGTMLHEIAEAHPHGGADAILADFEARWAERFDVDTWPRRVAHARARDMAVRLAAYLDARADVEVLTEQRFSVELGRAVLAGSADRVELRDGGAYVVDLKTGRAVPSVADAAQNPQLAMYQLAVASGAVDGVSHAVGAELAYVSTGKAGTSRVQAAVDPSQARARLDAVVVTMAAASFPAVVNDRCDACPVRRACPAHAQGAQVSDS